MPARREPPLVVVNQSGWVTTTIPVRDIQDAANRQIAHFAAAWGADTWLVTRALRRQGFRIVLLDTTDEADALAYHDLSPTGKPYASVFVQDILDHDGTWTEGANSVSAAVSHEILETLADPACNRYADGYDGYLYALEIVDPTEADSYEIDGIAVSNFVHPDYFNPWASTGHGARFDRLELITKPFAVRPDGYVLRHRGRSDQTKWGKQYPKWRRKMKTTMPHRRTRTRLLELERLTRGRAEAPKEHRPKQR
jgi:hypothetical protein